MSTRCSSLALSVCALFAVAVLSAPPARATGTGDDGLEQVGHFWELPGLHQSPTFVAKPVPADAQRKTVHDPTAVHARYDFVHFSPRLGLTKLSYDAHRRGNVIVLGEHLGDSPATVRCDRDSVSVSVATAKQHDTPSSPLQSLADALEHLKRRLKRDHESAHVSPGTVALVAGRCVTADEGESVPFQRYVHKHSLSENRTEMVLSTTESTFVEAFHSLTFDFQWYPPANIPPALEHLVPESKTRSYEHRENLFGVNWDAEEQRAAEPVLNLAGLDCTNCYGRIDVGFRITLSYDWWGDCWFPCPALHEARVSIFGEADLRFEINDTFPVSASTELRNLMEMQVPIFSALGVGIVASIETALAIEAGLSDGSEFLREASVYFLLSASASAEAGVGYTPDAGFAMFSDTSFSSEYHPLAFTVDGEDPDPSLQVRVDFEPVLYIRLQASAIGESDVTGLRVGLNNQANVQVAQGLDAIAAPAAFQVRNFSVREPKPDHSSVYCNGDDVVIRWDSSGFPDASKVRVTLHNRNWGMLFCAIPFVSCEESMDGVVDVSAGSVTWDGIESSHNTHNGYYFVLSTVSAPHFSVDTGEFDIVSSSGGIVYPTEVSVAHLDHDLDVHWESSCADGETVTVRLQRYGWLSDEDIAEFEDISNDGHFTISLTDSVKSLIMDSGGPEDYEFEVEVETSDHTMQSGYFSIRTGSPPPHAQLWEYVRERPLEFLTPNPNGTDVYSVQQTVQLSWTNRTATDLRVDFVLWQTTDDEDAKRIGVLAKEVPVLQQRMDVVVPLMSKVESGSVYYVEAIPSADAYSPFGVASSMFALSMHGSTSLDVSSPTSSSSTPSTPIYPGDTITVRWESEGINSATTVKIELYYSSIWVDPCFGSIEVPNSGSHEFTISDATPPDTGYYFFVTVPGTTVQSPYDSSVHFELYQRPSSMSITAPLSGPISTCTWLTVRWTSAGNPSEHVTIKLIDYDSGSSNEEYELTTSAENNGTFSFWVSGFLVETDNYFQIQNNEQSHELADSSDHDFDIVGTEPEISTTSRTLYLDRDNTVGWSSEGLCASDTVVVEFRKGGVTLLSKQVPGNVNSVVFTQADVVGTLVADDDYTLRVRASNPFDASMSESDSSSLDVRCSPDEPELSVSIPDDTWTVNSQHQVDLSWTGFCPGTRVSLELWDDNWPLSDTHVDTAFTGTLVVSSGIASVSITVPNVDEDDDYYIEFKTTGLSGDYDVSESSNEVEIVRPKLQLALPPQLPATYQRASEECTTQELALDLTMSHAITLGLEDIKLLSVLLVEGRDIGSIPAGEPYALLSECLPASFIFGSADATLSSLSLSSGSLSPAFNPLVLAYTASVDNDVASITVAATASSGAATLTINGGSSTQVSLSVGANSITVVVTAQSGATRTYTIAVTRAQALNVSPASLSFESMDSASVVASPLQIVTVRNSGEEALVVQSVVVSGPQRSDFAVSTGDNPVPISVAPGTSASVHVSFKPVSASPTTRQATLTVATGVGGRDVTASVALTGAVHTRACGNGVIDEGEFCDNDDAACNNCTVAAGFSCDSTGCSELAGGSVSATVSGSASTSVSAALGTTALQVVVPPVPAAGGSASLVVTPLASGAAAAPPSDFAAGAARFEITTSEQIDFGAVGPLVVRVQLVRASDGTCGEEQLFLFDTESNAWQRTLSTCPVDQRAEDITDECVLVATVCHLTEFATMVYAPSTTPESSATSSGGFPLVMAAGGAGALLVVVALLVYCCKRRRQPSYESQQSKTSLELSAQATSSTSQPDALPRPDASTGGVDGEPGTSQV